MKCSKLGDYNRAKMNVSTQQHMINTRILFRRFSVVYPLVDENASSISHTISLTLLHPLNNKKNIFSSYYSVFISVVFFII
jgi:hypothetical protein